MLNKRGYIEVGYFNIPKTHNMIPGDVFLSRKIREEDRLVSVLSDGLGSGVKANVLASLTATMALNYTASHSMNVMRSAETIMDTLPICSVRKISYSTFTIVDIDTTGRTRIIEHGNPSFVVLRPDGEVPLQRSCERLEKWEDRVITHTTFKASIEDRIVFFSDGVSQAGTGRSGDSIRMGRGKRRGICPHEGEEISPAVSQRVGQEHHGQGAEI